MCYKPKLVPGCLPLKNKHKGKLVQGGKFVLKASVPGRKAAFFIAKLQTSKRTFKADRRGSEEKE